MSEKLNKAELIEVEINLDNAIMTLEYNEELSEFTKKMREAQTELNDYIDNMKGELPMFMQHTENQYQIFKKQNAEAKKLRKTK